jgi:hypothetical protein
VGGPHARPKIKLNLVIKMHENRPLLGFIVPQACKLS